MKDLMNIDVKNELTMTSKEISELTGKRHDNVLADARSMLYEIQSPEISGDYTDTRGRVQKCILLNKEQTICLVSGYSVKVRMNIIKRWQELEDQQKPKLPATYLEALEQLVEKEKLLIAQAPKVKFVDNCVDRSHLMTATQVAQKHNMSAIKLNRLLSELDVYNRSIKRAKAFKQWFIDDGLGEMKQTELGHSQCLFTTKGEQWVNKKFIDEGVI